MARRVRGSPFPARAAAGDLSLGLSASIGEDLIHINGDRIDFTARSLLAVFRDIDVPAHKLFGAARNGYYAINVMKLGGGRMPPAGTGRRDGQGGGALATGPVAEKRPEIRPGMGESSGDGPHVFLHPATDRSTRIVGAAGYRSIDEHYDYRTGD